MCVKNHGVFVAINKLTFQGNSRRSITRQRSAKDKKPSLISIEKYLHLEVGTKVVVYIKHRTKEKECKAVVKFLGHPPDDVHAVKAGLEMVSDIYVN